MRLYNAQSCTPVGSSSIFVAPGKRSPPPSVLPRDKLGSGTATTSETAEHRGMSQPHDATNRPASPPLKHRQPSARRFDPFDLDELPEDPFDPKIATRSSETSATDELTPDMAAISKELSSSEEDEFAMFRSKPQQQEDEWPIHDHDEASNWSTSSTLSTKFTVNLFKPPRVQVTVTQDPEELRRAFSESPAFSEHVWPNQQSLQEQAATQRQNHAGGRNDKRVLPPRYATKTKQDTSRNPWPAPQELPEEAFPTMPSVASSPEKIADTATREQVAFHGVSGKSEFCTSNQNVTATQDGHHHSAGKSTLTPTQDASANVAASSQEYIAVRSRLKRVQNRGEPHRGTLESSSADAKANHVVDEQEAIVSHATPQPAPETSHKVPASKPPAPVKRNVQPSSRRGREARLSQPNTADENVTDLHKPVQDCQPMYSRPSLQMQSLQRQIKESSTSKSDPFVQGNCGPSVVEFNRQDKKKATFRTATDISAAKTAPSAFELTRQAERYSTSKANPSAPGDLVPSRSQSQRQVKKDSASRTSLPAPTAPSLLDSRAEAKLPVAPKTGTTSESPAATSLFDSLKKEIEKHTGKPSQVMTPKAKPTTRSKLSDKSLLQLQSLELSKQPTFPTQERASQVRVSDSAYAEHQIKRIAENVKNNTASQLSNWKDDPAFEKYARMLKLGLPLAAVQNCMQRDGVDPAILDNTDGPSDEPNESATCSKKVIRDGYRRTRLHWKTHDVVRSNTVWAMLCRDPDVSGLRVDEEEFLSLFRTQSKAPVRATSNFNPEQTAVKLIDPKRANNGGITLARIKLPYEDLAIAIDSLNETTLTQEQITGIIQYLPTTEEKRALVDFLNRPGSDPESLCECEKFMVAMMGVRKAKRKLNAILFMQRFSACVEELRRDARLVHKAFDEIMCSTAFRKILGIILSLGNKLNTASNDKAEAPAIALESLTMLNQVKAFDKKTTFLQYVASIVRRNNASLVHFKDELASVFHAQKVQWDQTLQELQKMESHLENIRQLALSYSQESYLPQPSGYPAADAESATLMTDLSMTLDDEVKMLRMTSIGTFTIEACVSMAAVVDEVDSAKVAFNACLLYFGEEGKDTLKPNELFDTISTFSKNFDSAVSAVAEREKIQLREAKRLSQAHPPQKMTAGESDALEASLSPRRLADVLGELRGKTKGKIPWRRRKHL